MKLLKIIASGLPLFDEKCEIDFFAQQRVNDESSEKMGRLFASSSRQYYQNNALAIIGINASGKTTVLKLISFVGGLLNNKPVNDISYSEIMDGLDSSSEAIFDIYFYDDNQTINWLHTVISKKDGRLVITDETLKSKPSSNVRSKISIFDFDNCKESVTRDNSEAFLLDDVSIMVAFNKKAKKRLAMTDMLQYTNINELCINEDCPLELISFFDPSIEYLRIKSKGKDSDIRLKFFGEEEIELNRKTDLNRYLSSGTIKGINTFSNAISTFKNGGYLIIDELENHFNHEIVSTLIRFYMDRKVNPKGAMLIFSTHYDELLDKFDRNDCIYIVRNRNGISAEKLVNVLKRNDIRKSEAYQSGFLGGTVPAYEAYIKLKKSLITSQAEAK